MSPNIINHNILDQKQSVIYNTEHEPSPQQALKCWTYNTVTDSRNQKYKQNQEIGSKQATYIYIMREISPMND